MINLGYVVEVKEDNCFNIPLDTDDKQFIAEGKTCFELIRSAPSPDLNCEHSTRQQINQISAFIDGGTVYGSTPDLNDLLRDPDSDCGELKISDTFNLAGHGETLPQSTDFKCPLAELNSMMEKNCFAAGDRRVNENAGLASMHTLFMREHNRIVRELKKINPNWNKEQCYNEARLIIIAMHQIITYKGTVVHFRSFIVHSYM